jgi:hypothetical protein
MYYLCSSGDSEFLHFLIDIPHVRL